MIIDVKFPDGYDYVDVQPYVDYTRNDKLTEEDKEILNKAANIFDRVNGIGYIVFGKPSLVSIEKKDGYLHVEIDEREAVSIEKRG